jgi:hypothetical protein
MDIAWKSVLTWVALLLEQLGSEGRRLSWYENPHLHPRGETCTPACEVARGCLEVTGSNAGEPEREERPPMDRNRDPRGEHGRGLPGSLGIQVAWAEGRAHPQTGSNARSRSPASARMPSNRSVPPAK